MPEKWRLVRIGDIAEKVAMGPFGSSIRVETFVTSGIPVISGQHLHGNRLDETPGFNFITTEHADRLKNANVQKGDVIFTHAGNIGQVAYIPGDSQYDRYVISQRQFYMRCNREYVIPEFIVYYFKTPEGRHKLLANTSQVGVPALAQPVSYLRSITIPLPPIAEQRAIASILGTLDDKIELNQRMNETLEAMARAIFKAWFVDFEPVRAKMEGRWRRGESLPGLPAHLYDLFPDRLVDSEHGEVPEGWNIGPLERVVCVVRETIDPQLEPDVQFQHFSIPAYDEGQTPRWERGEAIKSIKFLVPDDAVLLSKINPEIDRVWMVDVASDVQAICSTEFIVLTPRAPFGRCYIYCQVRSGGFRQDLVGLVTGTSKSHQRVHPRAVLNLPVLIPPVSVVEEFERIAVPLMRQRQARERESRTLAVMRDAVLPKLISGELRVEDFERTVGDLN